MTYLILDTNIWIYLANSKDPLTESFHEGYHFKLLDKITEMIQEGTVKLLSNQLILEEWERNKNATRDLISKYDSRLESEIRILREIRKALDGKYNAEIEAITDDYKLLFMSKIGENDLHIAKVEALLKSSEFFEVTNEIKVFTSDWAVAKKAPFVGKHRNSTADALILFSSIEFIKSQEVVIDHPDGKWAIRPTSIFISGNKNDFSSSKDDNTIHEDLATQLQTIEMEYFVSLPKALKSIDEGIFHDQELMSKMEEEIDEYLQDEDYCEECDFQDGFHFSHYIRFFPLEEIVNETSPKVNPYQLSLFGHVDNPDHVITSIQRGFCSNCDTEHIKCQKCKTVTPLNDEIGDIFQCVGCGITYQIINEYLGDGLSENTFKIIATVEQDEDSD